MNIVIPPEIVTFVNGAASFAAALALGWVAELVLAWLGKPIDVSPYVPAFAALLANLALTFFEGLLQQLPANFVPIVLQILVALLGVAASYAYQRQRLELKAYRALGPPNALARKR